MPDWSEAVRTRLSSLHLPPAREAEIIRELSDHLEDRYRELISSGMPPDEATGRTLAAFENEEALAARMSNLRQANTPAPIQPGAATGNPFANTWQDLRYAARVFMRRPGHTLAVIICLATGLTVSIGTFSVLMSLLYGEQPGITNRSHVVRLSVSYDTNDGRGGGGLAVDDFDILRQSVPALGSIAAEGRATMSVVGSRGPVTLTGAFVSGNYFQVLGTPAHAGRLLTPDDERTGAPPVTVVTEHFWRKYLDAKTEAIGSPILLAGQSFTVVGVAPPLFNGVQPERELGQEDSGIQIWIPLQHATSWPGVPPHSAPWLAGIGRLRDSQTIANARAQVVALANQLASAYPAVRANAFVSVRSNGITPNDTPFELLMFIGLFLSLPLTVLVISCANVTNLQLARATEREREFAVRLSLGASRWRLIRLLTLETTVLAGAAVFLSAIATTLLFKLSQGFLPINVSVDWRVAAFSLALMLGVTFLTGLFPAWLTLRRPRAEGLKQTVQAGGLKHSRLRSSLVVAQVALSLVMLCAAGVFVRALRAMEIEAPAVLRSQIVAVFDPAQMGPTKRASWQFADDLIARAAAHPGVKAVAVSKSSNLHSTRTSVREIMPSWLEVMDLPILRGRPLTADDQQVCLVSARLAEEIAPNGSALGQILQVEDDSARQRGLEIVGIVADNQTGPLPAGGRPAPVAYVSLPRDFTGFFELRVRAKSSESVSGLMDDMQNIVRAVDPRLPWLTMQRGDSVYLGDAPFMRYVAQALAVLGFLALGLAATGLYAVMSYVVLLRRREIGVRIAIGAAPSQIVWLIVRQAVRLVGTGGVVGLGVAIPLGFALRSFFTGTVSPLDPATLLPPFAVLLIVALVAAALPARRASAIDPLNTLREE